MEQKLDNIEVRADKEHILFYISGQAMRLTLPSARDLQLALLLIYNSRHKNLEFSMSCTGDSVEDLYTIDLDREDRTVEILNGLEVIHIEVDSLSVVINSLNKILEDI